MSYAGPGRYRHYKGGTYYVLGIGEGEADGRKMVIYYSESAAHEEERAARGVDFVLRPLDSDDGVDAWNELARGGLEERFVLIEPAAPLGEREAPDQQN
jgi:hypothetical protein